MSQQREWRCIVADSGLLLLLTGRFTFTYREPDADGEGWFELAPDGKTFESKWHETGETECRLTFAADAGAPGTAIAPMGLRVVEPAVLTAPKN